MNINEIAKTVSAEILFQSETCRDKNIEYAVAADLMSEVMIGTVDGSLIVTGLMNPQVIRTAEMMKGKGTKKRKRRRRCRRQSQGLTSAEQSLALPLIRSRPIMQI